MGAGSQLAQRRLSRGVADRTKKVIKPLQRQRMRELEAQFEDARECDAARPAEEPCDAQACEALAGREAASWLQQAALEPSRTGGRLLSATAPEPVPSSREGQSAPLAAPAASAVAPPQRADGAAAPALPGDAAAAPASPGGAARAGLAAPAASADAKPQRADADDEPTRTRSARGPWWAAPRLPERMRAAGARAMIFAA